MRLWGDFLPSVFGAPRARSLAPGTRRCGRRQRGALTRCRVETQLQFAAIRAEDLDPNVARRPPELCRRKPKRLPARLRRMGMRTDRDASYCERNGHRCPARIAKPEERKAKVAIQLVSDWHVFEVQHECVARRRVRPEAAPRSIMLILDDGRADEVALGRST